MTIAGLEPSYKIMIDVNALQPVKIRISPTDSISRTHLIVMEKTIYQNIQGITFLKDTIDAEIFIEYHARPAPRLSNSFAELIAENIVRITYPRKTPIGYRGGSPKLTKTEKDTVVLHRYLVYKTGELRPSNILFERKFLGDRDTTIVLTNNYPEYEEEALEIANQYEKADFEFYSSKVKYYYVKFRIIHRIEECGHEAIY